MRVLYSLMLHLFEIVIVVLRARASMKKEGALPLTDQNVCCRKCDGDSGTSRSQACDAAPDIANAIARAATESRVQETRAVDEAGSRTGVLLCSRQPSGEGFGPLNVEAAEAPHRSRSVSERGVLHSELPSFGSENGASGAVHEGIHGLHQHMGIGECCGRCCSVWPNDLCALSEAEATNDGGGLKSAQICVSTMDPCGGDDCGSRGELVVNDKWDGPFARELCIRVVGRERGAELAQRLESTGDSNDIVGPSPHPPTDLDGRRNHDEQACTILCRLADAAVSTSESHGSPGTGGQLFEVVRFIVHGIKSASARQQRQDHQGGAAEEKQRAQPDVFEIESIVEAETRSRRRGYWVIWAGYMPDWEAWRVEGRGSVGDPLVTWEPEWNVRNTEAFQEWLQREHGSGAES